MEGGGAPSGRGPAGPGAGGVLRELCRGFGHYNRHLARLQHNLRETKKFFRDIKYSQGPPFPPADGEPPPAAAAHSAPGGSADTPGTSGGEGLGIGGLCGGGAGHRGVLWEDKGSGVTRGPTLAFPHGPRTCHDAEPRTPASLRAF